MSSEVSLTEDSPMNLFKVIKILYQSSQYLKIWLTAGYIQLPGFKLSINSKYVIGSITGVSCRSTLLKNPENHEYKQ